MESMGKKKAHRKPRRTSTTVDNTQPAAAETRVDATPLSAEEKAELAALRQENRQLKADIEILERAKAFFKIE
jgi:transposase-like protein